MIGFPDNICDKETRGNPTIDRVYVAPDYTRNDEMFRKKFYHFLDENSPGTGMDTAFGAFVRNTIKILPDRDFCDPTAGLLAPFQACHLLSYDPSGKARFNVLLYAHVIASEPFEPLIDSSGLKMFQSCWKLLQQICGHNATYYEYNYRLSAGSREIQRMMDNLTCEWQDMLIGHYIEASEHGNIWPTTLNMPGNPLFLSSGRSTFGSLTNSLSGLISIVSRGVKEISAKCGMVSAKRVRLFYDRLQYNFYAELHLYNMVQKVFSPYQIYRLPSGIGIESLSWVLHHMNMA